jgi:uncharacterized protein YciU (UPF0263 family)
MSTSHNVRLLFDDQSSQPEAVKAMGEAYDLALELAPEGISPEALARAVISAARSGERDAVRLCDQALYVLRQR